MTFASDHFSAIAAKYAAYRPSYPAELVDVLASLTTPDVAWDVGCGNGQLSTMLAEKFARVIATDPSEAQIAAAVRHPRVEYAVGSAEQSKLPDASVDLVVAAQAAHWFDWPRFVGEAERVAKPGALVALVTYGIMLVDGEIGRELTHYYRNVVGNYWPKGREHVENGYRDLVMPWPAVAAPALDMRVEWTHEELIGYVSTWSATARLVDAEGPAPYEHLRARLAELCGESRVIVRWPLALKFARR